MNPRTTDIIQKLSFIKLCEINDCYNILKLTCSKNNYKLKKKHAPTHALT